MVVKVLSRIASNFSTISCFRLGSDCISRITSKADYNTIIVGVTLWYGVILDYNSMFSISAEKASLNRGRIVKHAIDGWDTREGALESFLTTLDELADMLLMHISHRDGFKSRLLLAELKTWVVPSWIAPLKGCILEIVRNGFAIAESGDEVQVVRAIRQMSCFLKKLDVNRPDLVALTGKAFFDFEEELSVTIPIMKESPAYQRDVAAMRTLLNKHLDNFTMQPFVPGHGPGAVADSVVKCWYDKHVSACSDARVSYLLDHAMLGSQDEYLPLIKVDKSSRTSRFVCVPKTWKKLRGISCEPSELQFWQQGLLRRIDSMFRHDKWWSHRINLHDQERSRNLALQGSKNGVYATVDLSAASDSVTLQLVRDLFGNTELGRWLIGTRSIFTECGDRTIRINKYAPMGSASCFPVECMIFCLAAEIAVGRARRPFQTMRQVCVFGDDIILPSYAVPELLSILSNLGFAVNTDKSFWEGEFKEACGMEAWRGQSIAPCRYKACPSGIADPRTDHEEIASLVAFANELLGRGLHDTRAFLLDILLNKNIQLKKTVVPVRSTIFATFSGEGQTLASPTPTNFNLERKFDRSLQTHVYKRVVWREKPNARTVASEMSERYDVCEYVNWLIRHQSGVLDFDALWSLGWIESADVNPYARLPIGTMMVPTCKWVLPPATTFRS